MEKEIWKDVPGYEGLYQASNLGRIKSVDRTVVDSRGGVRKYKGKLMAMCIGVRGRVDVSLYKNGKRRIAKVHSLIMETFVGDRPKGYDICHANGDKLDNRLVNLSYDTKTQNSIDFYRQGSKSSPGKLTAKEALEVRKLYKTGIYSKYELSDIYKIHHSSVCKIINRKSFAWLNDDGSINESNTKID